MTDQEILARVIEIAEDRRFSDEFLGMVVRYRASALRALLESLAERNV